MDFTINGKPLSALRVVDLKVELEKRGLPKSGNKTDLIERLTHHLVRQTQNQNDPVGISNQSGGNIAPGAQPPNMSLSHGLTDNDFVRDYLKLRESQFASALSEQDSHLQRATNLQSDDLEEQPLSRHVRGDHVAKRMHHGTYPNKDNTNQELYNDPSCIGAHPVQASFNQAVQEKEALIANHPGPATYGIPQTNPGIGITKDDRLNDDLPRNLQGLGSNDKETHQAQELSSPISVARDQSIQEKEASNANKDKEAMPPKSASTEGGASVFEEEKVGIASPETKDLKKESSNKSNEDHNSVTENSVTPECDEIVVSNSPILPDFEEAIDEEKEGSTKIEEENSPPPPPDTTFRKLSRPLSNDPLIEDLKKKKRQWVKKETKEEDQDEGNGADIVSGESLKDIVPDVKPYLEDLGKEDELDHEQETEEEEMNGGESDVKQPTLEESLNEKKESPTVKSPALQSLQNSDTGLDQTNKARRGATSKLNPERSCVIEVRNLVRPFTNIQFKELLLRTGKINKFENGGFWMDKIKSHAIIEYVSPDEADETVMALDGVKWPSTNPKKLIVTFSSKELLGKAIKDNSAPEKSNIITEYSRRVSNREEHEDLSRKRKYSENQTDSLRDKYREDALISKRVRNDSEKEASAEKEKTTSPKPKKHLDDLFRKTKALPCIYWLPKQQKQDTS